VKRWKARFGEHRRCGHSWQVSVFINFSSICIACVNILSAEDKCYPLRPASLIKVGVADKFLHLGTVYVDRNKLIKDHQLNQTLIIVYLAL
jgi:hypothetical protein